MSDDLVKRLRRASVQKLPLNDYFKAAADRITALEAENAAFRAGLASIASNTCCTTCQEAALVAKATLRKEATK